MRAASITAAPGRRTPCAPAHAPAAGRHHSNVRRRGRFCAQGRAGGRRGGPGHQRGAGNVNDALFQGILQALNAGIPVVIASRVPYGEVRPVYAYSGGGIALLRAGAIFARDLNPQKARVLLMAGLGAGMASLALVSLFNQ
ncbi:hypothetical protein [Candidatus Amarolinea dominans]|uniref:hypothetical protein n=1 Tax=Candidatus Amarolinea dominans TaxID=3140696 RepID=UPI0031CCBB01